MTFSALLAPSGLTESGKLRYDRDTAVPGPWGRELGTLVSEMINQFRFS